MIYMEVQSKKAKQLNGEETARTIVQTFPGSVESADRSSIIVDSTFLYQIAEHLKNAADLDFNFLSDITSVDYEDYFEVIYHLVSLNHNHMLTLKTRCYNKDNPQVPSVVKLWRSADFQEREVYDLMGITFNGHPNMKRLLLWEGFEGHPLRKDYL
jgi:NADH-quinone oxidoreductase subunit C